MAKKEKKLFTREATGLVREVRVLDSVIFNIIAIIGVGPVLFLAQVSLFPGANLPLTLLMFIVPAFFTFMLYRELSISMPRSGGDYIYVSRIINPGVGFVGSVLAWMGALLSLGVIVFYFVYILDTVFSLGLAANPIMFLLVGTGFLALMTLQSIFKAAGFKIFRYAFIIAAILTVVLFVSLLSINTATFIANWNAGPLGSAGLTYAGVQSLATTLADSNGNFWSSSFTIGATFMAIIFPMTYVLGFGSTQVGGELKDYKKSLTYALFVTLIGMTVFYLLLTLVTFNAFGQNFLTSYGWTYWYAPDPLHTILQSAPPALILFMNFGGLDTTLLLLSALGMLIWSYMMIPAATLLWSRYVFAWSFDRVTPMRFGDVNERTRSPVWAIVVSAIVVWFGFIGTSLSLALVGIVYYLSLYLWTAIVGISGVLFARRKKDIYQKSPIKGSVLKVQKVTWAGIITAIYFIISIPLIFLYPTALIPYAPIGIAITAAALIAAILIYFRSKSKNRAAGIDVDKIFGEIPPE